MSLLYGTPAEIFRELENNVSNLILNDLSFYFILLVDVMSLYNNPPCYTMSNASTMVRE